MSMLGIIASQSSLAFLPSAIPGLELWLDASDVATVIESGGDVSEWKDKSVNGNDATQFTGSSQPQFLSSGIDGKGAIDFTDPTIRFMTLDSLISETDLTATVVFVPFMATGNIGFILSGPSTVNNQVLRMQINIGANGILTAYDGTNQTDFALPASILGIPSVMTTEFDTGVGVKIYQDGDLKVTGTYDGNIQVQQIGRLLTITPIMSCFLGEMVIYNRILSAAEKLALDNYMLNKWGI